MITASAAWFRYELRSFSSSPHVSLFSQRLRNFDVMALWRERAVEVTGRALPCGHYIAEEAPALLLDEVFDFFRS